MISTSVILPDHYILLSLPFLTSKYAIVRISVSQGTFLVKKICVNSVCDSVRSAQSPRVQKERSPALFALPESALFSAFLFLLFSAAPVRRSGAAPLFLPGNLSVQNLRGRQRKGTVADMAGDA